MASSVDPGHKHISQRLHASYRPSTECTTTNNSLEDPGKILLTTCQLMQESPDLMSDAQRLCLDCWCCGHCCSEAQ